MRYTWGMYEEGIIQNTETFVRSRLENEGTGHDWFHADRVRKTGLTLQETEGGDRLVIELALLLHDVGDRKVLNLPDDDPTIAASFLQSQKIGQVGIEAIMHIITHMSYSKSLDGSQIEKPIEFQIVQDADRVDALGAIGIARAFAFGGSRGRLLYNPAAQAEEFATTESYKQSTGSTLHHFDEKLFKLKDGFNTETARKMAAERDAFMHTFYDRFLAEWNGRE